MSTRKERADEYMKAAEAAELLEGPGWRVDVEEVGDGHLHGDYLVVSDDQHASEVLKQGEAGTGADCEFVAMASTTGVELARDVLVLLRQCAAWKQAARRWRRRAGNQLTRLQGALAAGAALIGWVGVQEPGSADEACPTAEEIRHHAKEHEPGLWMCWLPRIVYKDASDRVTSKPPELLVGQLQLDDEGVPWFECRGSSFPLRPTTGRAGAKGYRIWPLNASGDKVPRPSANSSEKSNSSPPPSVQELALAHFCERCSGFVQHCPTLDVQTRLQVAERIVELRREDLAEAKNRTSLYDHEEEMLENAEQVLQEVKDEADEAVRAGEADAARPS